jgi:glucose dehydrogenase
MVRSTTPAACCFSRAPAALAKLPPRGALIGYDVARGRIAWSARVDGLAYGGSAVTAGDLVFSGESGGYVDAHDARNGRLLWQYRTVAGADAAPAVYVSAGREYLAIAAGGNTVIDSRRGDVLDVFALH